MSSKRVDVTNPNAISPTNTTCPASLQQACRGSILDALTLKRLERVEELPISKPLINFLTSRISCEDFFVKRDDLNAVHINNCMYPARCLLDNSAVILKCFQNEVLMSTDVKESFENWFALDHPNLMKCFKKFQENETTILVFEKQSLTLPDLVRKLRDETKTIPEYILWKTINNLGQVLQCIQEKNLITDELKPDQVFFDCDGVCKLESGLLYLPKNEEADMMQAMAFDEDGMTGIYTSPEVLSEEGVSDKTVVWYLGCILYEMTKLQPAYAIEDGDLFGAMNRIMEEQPPAEINSGFSDDLKSTISRCLKFKVDERPSLDELISESMRKSEELNSQCNITSILDL